MVMDVLENLGRRRIEPGPGPEVDKGADGGKDVSGEAELILLLSSSCRLNNDSEGREGKGGGIANGLFELRVDGTRGAGVGES